MSTSYSASIFYGYTLAKTDLFRNTPNPLWGKHKYNPDTGEKVDKFIEEEIDLGLEDGDSLSGMTRFVRFDDIDSIVLGVERVGTGDLSYGGETPQKINLFTEAECKKIVDQAKKLIEKAGLVFDERRVGYWLVSHVG